jgi:hypothetical protein
MTITLFPAPPLPSQPFDEGEIWGGRLFIHQRESLFARHPITKIIRDMSVDQPIERAATSKTFAPKC